MLKKLSVIGEKNPQFLKLFLFAVNILFVTCVHRCAIQRTFEQVTVNVHSVGGEHEL